VDAVRHMLSARTTVSRRLDLKPTTTSCIFFIFLTIVYDLMNYNFVSLIVVNIFFSDGLFFTIRLGYEVTKNGIYCVGVVRLVHLRVFEE
jgi:hypothetical protein